MADGDTIPEFYYDMFTRNVQHLLQQEGAILRAGFTEPMEQYSGKGAQAVKQYGKTKARVGADDRYGDTPINETPRSQRWVFPVLVDWGDIVEWTDLIRQMEDPTSDLVQAAVKAMGRALDEDVMIPAFYGAAPSGENGSGTTAFDSNNEIAVTVGNGGAGNVGLNVIKLIKAKEKLMANFVDVERDDIHMGISSRQWSDLLQIPEFSSGDYRTGRILESGTVSDFLGIKFHLLENLPKSGNNRQCPIWAKSKMHLGVWQDLKVNVGPDPGKKFNARIYMKQTHGAVRLEEGGVVRVLCDET